MPDPWLTSARDRGLTRKAREMTPAADRTCSDEEFAAAVRAQREPQSRACYWAMYDLAFGTAFRKMVRAGIHWREAAQEIRDWEYGGEHGP